MSKSKQIGTAAETALVNYLRSEGFLDADREPLRGSGDTGDVSTAGVCWEVKAGAAAKAASDGLVGDWLAETERERQNARAGLGVLVMARAGYGAQRVGSWWAVVPLWALNSLTAIPGSRYEKSAGQMWQPVRLHLSTLVALLKARASV